MLFYSKLSSAVTELGIQKDALLKFPLVFSLFKVLDANAEKFLCHHIHSLLVKFFLRLKISRNTEASREKYLQTQACKRMVLVLLASLNEHVHL